MIVQDTFNNEEKSSIPLYFICLFTIITLILIILRLFFLDVSDWIQETKDIDFKILIEGMENGLIGSIVNWK